MATKSKSATTARDRTRTLITPQGRTTIGLLGASGRMGLWVQKLLATEFSKRAVLAAAPFRTDTLATLFECEVVIDFSSPDAVIRLCKEALQFHQKSEDVRLPCLVIGSTGFTSDQKQTLRELSNLTPVIQSSNFATGVLALLHILQTHSGLFRSLGYKPVIIDTHHQHKRDAPSGTAIALQRAIDPLDEKSIETHSIRAGEIIGTHEVTFYGAADFLKFTHFAQERSIFARGAIEVALWLSRRREASPQEFKRGWFTIDDYFADLATKN
jgi:4-hydroxy-tetrahydrodipicolinate reductase